jgi:glucuronosyltransferase
VFFSLGSYINSGEMPKEKITAILEAFRNTKKTIFWKFDGDIPAGVPDNVIIQNWFPQNDLLANPSVVLFITSGSSLSYQEAIFHRVPMLIIPLTGDQYRNALDAERNGYGKMLLFDDMDEKTLANAILEITKDTTYFTRIGTAFAKLVDNPVDPMKEALYWIQHVAKYGTVEKSPSADYSWITYYNVDVVAFYFSILFFCVLCWAITIKLILDRYRHRETKGKFKYY